MVGRRPHLVLLPPPDLSLSRAIYAAFCRASHPGLVFLPAGANLLPLCRDLPCAVAGRAGAIGGCHPRCGCITRANRATTVYHAAAAGRRGERDTAGAAPGCAGDRAYRGRDVARDLCRNAVGPHAP